MKRTIVSLVVFCGLGLVASQGFAQVSATCGPSISVAPVDSAGNPVDSGFELYTYLTCGQYWINRYWYGYGFEREYWDQGFGYHDACDSARPLGRTFGAMRYLDEASDWGSYHPSGRTWHDRASGSIDSIKGQCGGGGRNAEMDLWSNVTLYWPAFYGQPSPSHQGTVGELASLIVHESQHEWHWHNGESCGSCDEAWDDSPVMYYEIQYLARTYQKQPRRTYGCYDPVTNNIDRYCKSSYYLSEAQLDLMRDKGNFRIRNNFDTRPSYRIASRAQPWSL